MDFLGLVNKDLDSIDRELIWIPSEPIRQSWIYRYRLFEKKLEKLKREWLLFEQEAIPQYHRWYHSTFAAELAQVNEWTEKAREQEMILAAIVAHQRIYILDEVEAYRRVRKKLQNKQDPFPDAEDIDLYEKKLRQQAELDQQRREAAFRARLEQAKKFTKVTEPLDREDTSRDLNPKPPTDSTVHRNDELRSTYRKIVRELHPDLGHEMNEIEKEWWNQAQEAYRAKDLELLKLLALKVLNQGDIAIDKIDHIGTLIDLCVSLVDQQNQIESQKRRLKRDPVYRFWASRGRSQNRGNLEFELSEHLQFQFRRLKEFVGQAERGLRSLDRILRGEYQASDDEKQTSRRKNNKAESPGGRGRGKRKSR